LEDGEIYLGGFVGYSSLVDIVEGGEFGEVAYPAAADIK